MKIKNRNSREKFVLVMNILLICLLLLQVIGCGSPPDSVQTGDTGWVAKRYNLYNKVWGSISSASQVEVLDNTERPIVMDGYVTTDVNGQARMRRTIPPNCTIYVFQDTSLTSSPETISTCPRGTSCPGNATFHAEDCNITLSTLPATITFVGTQVTIIENRELESVVVLVSEGTARVTPVDPAVAPFEVSAPLASYAVTSERLNDAINFFGFNPGEIVEFQRFVEPIQKLGVTRQIQSANLILRSQDLQMVPLAVPFTLGLRWLTEQQDDIRVSQGIAQAVDWNASLDAVFPGIPLLFETQGQVLDVRSLRFDPQSARAQLAEAGVPPEQVLVIAFDESIPGLVEVAGSMVEQLKGNAGVAATFQPFNPDNAEGVFAELEASETPVLVLSGF